MLDNLLLTEQMPAELASQTQRVHCNDCQANSDVAFQLDEQLGRVRGLELGPVPARRTSWGQLKRRYR